MTNDPRPPVSSSWGCSRHSWTKDSRSKDNCRRGSKIPSCWDLNCLQRISNPNRPVYSWLHHWKRLNPWSSHNRTSKIRFRPPCIYGRNGTNWKHERKKSIWASSSSNIWWSLFYSKKKVDGGSRVLRMVKERRRH